MTQSIDANQGTKIDNGRVAHVVGVYDKDANLLKLYYNGVLVATADYGNRNGWNLGSAKHNTFGIGMNVAYPSKLWLLKPVTL